MPLRTESGTAFLVEHYLPGQPIAALERALASVRTTLRSAEREGRAVRFVSSTLVPGDEAFLCVVEATSAELVRETFERAGITFERISVAIVDTKGEGR